MAALVSPADEMKALLPRCVSGGSVGMEKGEKPLLPHCWQWQAEETGRIVSMCQAALLLL